jgi:ABC-type multidrug transport system ATPase subunit
MPVRIEGLTKRLAGGVLAVDGLDLFVEQGQILGLAGPNGAGKSVTLKMMLGLVRPTKGRVELFGQPVHAGAQVLGRVGSLVDGPGFVPHLSGRENLRLAWRMMGRRAEGNGNGGGNGNGNGSGSGSGKDRRADGQGNRGGKGLHADGQGNSGGKGLHADGQGNSGGKGGSAVEDGSGGLDHAIDLTGLGAAIDRPFKTYSHGMRYRLGLAQALMGRPDLLLLDEPTTGLDPAHILETRAAISTAAAGGATVVFSSHLLSEVERVCTHAAVMRAGRLVAHGTVSELKGDHGSLEEAYLDLVGATDGNAIEPDEQSAEASGASTQAGAET